jgi:hypothetical protein
MTALIRRFKGMIRPNMAVGIEDSRKIMRRKSIWMVEYLRARRDPGLLFKALARRRHLEGLE